MSHYDPDRVVHIAPADAAAVVHRFLSRCKTWATEKEIPKRLTRVAETNDPLEAAKLHEWVAWVNFVDHAIHEVETGKLDPWLEQDADR